MGFLFGELFHIPTEKCNGIFKSPLHMLHEMIEMEIRTNQKIMSLVTFLPFFSRFWLNMCNGLICIPFIYYSSLSLHYSCCSSLFFLGLVLKFIKRYN
jgi:hypothetical protein